MDEPVIPVVPAKDPLLLGEQRTWSAYLPVALIEAVKASAQEDGFRSAGSYAAQLLVFALRVRERERAHSKRK